MLIITQGYGSPNLVVTQGYVPAVLHGRMTYFEKTQVTQPWVGAGQATQPWLEQAEATTAWLPTGQDLPGD